MAATKDQILESISNMTVMEVVELISEMEEKFGVTAAAPVAAAPFIPASPFANPIALPNKGANCKAILITLVVVLPF